MKDPEQSIFAVYAMGSIASILLVFIVLLRFVLLPKGFQNVKRKDLEPKLLNHVIVTGGSSGIGLAIAHELVQRRCKTITLLARNVDRLNEVKAKLESQASSINNEDTSIYVYSVDVGNADAVKKAAQEICGGGGLPAPTILFNIAGMTLTGKFLDIDLKEFEKLMQCNYQGTVNVTHEFLPYMLLEKEKKSPRVIVFTSSAAGQTGIFGYTAYAPTKFALRGLAESLQMELLRHNIFVQLAYPPDTNTPGYQEERIGIPEETELIAATAGLFKAEDVAKQMVSSVLQHRPAFSIYFGLEGWMLSTLSAGMNPAHSVLDALCQILLMGLFRFVSFFYLMDFRRIIYKVGNRKQKKWSNNKKYN